MVRVMVGVMKKIRVKIDLKKRFGLWRFSFYAKWQITKDSGKTANYSNQSMHLLIEMLSADHRWNGKLVRGKTKLFFNTQAPHFEWNKGFCGSFDNDLLCNFYLQCAWNQNSHIRWDWLATAGRSWNPSGGNCFIKYKKLGEKEDKTALLPNCLKMIGWAGK